MVTVTNASVVHVGMHIGFKHRCFVGSIPIRGTKFNIMKTHRITIEGKDWKDSKYNSREWEKRVNIVRYEHDYVSNIYHIDIGIKD